MPINIVIPMAGQGSRFSKKGYSKPKPFIEFNGKMMVEHVLDGLERDQANYILIIKKEFEQNEKKCLEQIKKSFSVSLLSVEGVTLGPACTALRAHSLINNNIPVLFSDSDTILRKEDVEAFIEDAMARDLDGSLLTFDSQENYYSYVQIDSKGLALKVREKEPISTHAIAGAYYVKSGQSFVNETIQMLISKERKKDEFYMSDVFDALIDKGKKVGIHEIEKNRVHCVGTPEQLHHYLSDQKHLSPL